MSPDRQPSPRKVRALRKLDAWSERAEDAFVVGFFVAIGVVGVLGVTGLVSLSAREAFPNFFAIVLWCAIYMIGTVLGVLGRTLRCRNPQWRNVEGWGLVAVAAATVLQAYVLLQAGDAGTQTGTRLLAGVFLIAANIVLAFRAAKAEPLERTIARVLRERAREDRPDGTR